MRQKWESTDFSKRIQKTPTSNGFDTFFGISASLDMPPYVFIENDRVVELPHRLWSLKTEGPSRTGVPRLATQVCDRGHYR